MDQIARLILLVLCTCTIAWTSDPIPIFVNDIMTVPIHNTTQHSYIVQVDSNQLLIPTAIAKYNSHITITINLSQQGIQAQSLGACSGYIIATCPFFTPLILTQPSNTTSSLIITVETDLPTQFTLQIQRSSTLFTIPKQQPQNSEDEDLMSVIDVQMQKDGDRLTVPMMIMQDHRQSQRDTVLYKIITGYNDGQQLDLTLSAFSIHAYLVHIQTDNASQYQILSIQDQQPLPSELQTTTTLSASTQILNLLSLTHINNEDAQYGYMLLITRKDYTHEANIVIQNTRMSVEQIGNIELGDMFMYMYQPALRNHLVQIQKSGQLVPSILTLQIQQSQQFDSDQKQFHYQMGLNIDISLAVSQPQYGTVCVSYCGELVRCFDPNQQSSSVSVYIPTWVRQQRYEKVGYGSNYSEEVSIQLMDSDIQQSMSIIAIEHISQFETGNSDMLFKGDTIISCLNQQSIALFGVQNYPQYALNNQNMLIFSGDQYQFTLNICSLTNQCIDIDMMQNSQFINDTNTQFINDTNTMGYYQYTYTPQPGYMYLLKISSTNQTSSSYFMLTYAQSPSQVVDITFVTNRSIEISTEITDILQYQESVFYRINLSHILHTDNSHQVTQNTTLILWVQYINGMFNLYSYRTCLTSTNDSNVLDGLCPVQQQTDIYQTQPILSMDQQTLYFQVSAQQQSVFRVHAYLDNIYPQPQPQPQPQPTPQPINILQSIITLIDGHNTIQLQQLNSAVNNDSKVIMGIIGYYSAHIIPYSLRITQQQQQLNQNCIWTINNMDKLSDIFNSSTYSQLIQSCNDTNLEFNEKSDDISDQNVYIAILMEVDEVEANLLVDIQVIVPVYKLSSQTSPLLITCAQMCYTDISVQTNLHGNIVKAIGRGTIYQSQITSNATQQQLILTCDSNTICHQTISANLPFGGYVLIYLQPLNISLVTWQPNYINTSIPTTYNLFIPLNRYSQVNSLIIQTSMQIPLCIEWTLITVNTSQTNIRQQIGSYSSNQTYLPSREEARSSHFGKQSIISLDPSNQGQCGDLNGGLQCYVYMQVTISNNAVENMPSTVVEDIFITFSINSYAHNLPIDVPFIIREQFGIIYYGLSPAYPSSEISLTLLKLSQCPTLNIDYLQTSNLDYIYSVSNTQPCTYVTLITPNITCKNLDFSDQHPTIIAGTPFQFTASQTNILYSSSYMQQQQGQISMQIWRRDKVVGDGNSSWVSRVRVILAGPFDTNSNETDAYNECDLMGADCSADMVVLCKEMVIDAQLGIYTEVGQQQSGNTIIKTESEVGAGRYRLIIVSLSKNNSKNSQQTDKPQLSILVLPPLKLITILPNSLHIPLPLSVQEPIYLNYYSEKKDLKICFYLITEQSMGDSLYYSLSVLKEQQQIYNETELEYENILGRGYQCIPIQTGSSDSSQVHQYHIQLVITSNQTAEDSQLPQYILIKIEQPITYTQVSPLVAAYHSYSPLIHNNFKCYNIHQWKNINYHILLTFDQSSHQNISQPIITVQTQNKEVKFQCETLTYSERQNSQILGYKCSLNQSQLTDTVDSSIFCISAKYSYYVMVDGMQNKYHTIQNMLNKQKLYHEPMIIPKQSFAYDIFAYTSLASPMMFGEFDNQSQTRDNRVLVQIIDCNGVESTPSILGSSIYSEIMSSKITDFEDQYINNGVFIGLSTLQTPGYYYYGVKYEQSSQNQPLSLNYSIQAFHYTDGVIPHQKWALSDLKITNIAVDEHLLVVQLPKVISLLNQSSPSDYQFVYNIYVGRTEQKVNQYARCKSLFSSQNEEDNGMEIAQIFDQQVVNPHIPLFKINVNSLSNDDTEIKVDIIGKVTIYSSQDPDFIPLQYYYQPTQAIIPRSNADKQNTVNLGLVFLMLVGAIFIFILLRFLYKVWKRRSSRNSLQFELSENVASDRPSQPNNRQSRNQRRIEGYGQFVDEIV